MEIDTVRVTQVHLVLTEEEAEWLRLQMQNYVEPMRLPTQPPIQEDPKDRVMRYNFFTSLNNALG